MRFPVTHDCRARLAGRKILLGTLLTQHVTKTCLAAGMPLGELEA